MMGLISRRAIAAALGFATTLPVFVTMIPYRASAQQATPAPAGRVVELPIVQVVDTSPLAGAGIAADKVPGAVYGVSAQDFQRLYTFSVTDGLFQYIPGVTTSDVQGNPFFQDFRYRGFAASPLQGTPQGIAVYQNGIRLNEAFGDTVNWDLVPTIAIDRADVYANNPVFGLNALGGAVSIQMKNGFTYHGLEGTIQGGSFGQVGGSVQYGIEKDGVGLYVAADALREDGWRLQSPSELVRFYGDLGWKGDKGEVHITAQLARNSLGVIGPTPVEMLAFDNASVYTWPQTTTNAVGALALNGKYDLSDAWQLQGTLYVRRFKQAHVDGNDAELEGCSARWNPTIPSGRLCLEEDDFTGPPGGGTVASNPLYAAFRSQMVLYNQLGQTVPFASLPDNVLYGVINRTNTETTTTGGSVQAVSNAPLLGHGNHFVIGGSVDYSTINFQSSAELGLTDVNTLGVSGLGVILANRPNTSLPSEYVVTYLPVNLNATTTYYGLYATDAFDITDRLTSTWGARLNIARISMSDGSGISPELNGDYTFSRVNPMLGLTYKLTPDISLYGGYSESNRAPTPLELNCADPNRPCILENSLVADPPLNQVVSHTYEAGLRGRHGALGGLVDWKVGFYRTDADDDIIALASPQTGYGYYTNVPSTRRQGFEASVQYASGPWMFYANYSYIDATFQFSGALSSPNNPSAVDGEVFVTPGDHMPGIPTQTLKVGMDYMITPQWKVGGDIIAASSQYYVGDEANQNPKLPGYWIANIRTSYQITRNFQVFALANNIFNEKYATYGTYFDTGYLGLNNPEMQTPGQPLAVYVGARGTF
ncbi:membrane protein [Azorhizobium oxalatiphilum]|uniref:Membrane protein n=1 Tax=Azorhizobium oxalatiphilum TaxID=980631 RepID=A0A917C9D7_9HYPH|nr:TonB-dependent receptor [Azorhizobium oxalatiphilum]GGF78953.1 membrane protein [Azorhizobium oxalatiphilum]